MIVTVVVTLVLVGGLAAAASAVIPPLVPGIQKIFGGSSTAADFTGTGTGEKVDFVINSGDDGSMIGDNLAAQGIVGSSAIFYKLLLTQPDVVFQPGTYTLSKQMSAQSALTALEDPANHVTNQVVIPEGTLAAEVLTTLSTDTGVPLTDLQAEAANFTQFGIDASAPNIEGYLFPATYTFEPNTSAKDLLKTMVDRTFQSLDTAGVPVADREKVLTLASVIQKEARLEPDFYKVSRVFTNRIADDMPLQSDATVAYGTGEKRVDTTDAERNDESNPYNTYVHTGLPVGPISNPGDTAIDAAMHPADGTWLYFVTINLDTGETVFSTSYDDHLKAVAQYQAWSAANPGAGG
ncbi:endolytic transglycosylase MltG [Subtercola boreus]|uniref:endolytic transglycosylase MltG n=1 Tax=Subtercola boreus TaxID=120213 RepID=UPI00209BED95|nr:endolytic transglycosylase MltG [Subtercola boreus]